ncbi:KGG domain-containing protein [Bdellovibrio sp. NC01]|uniref:KGG domain-containing protein n=1 Tax=Bdellovibrio sp. NC01 TaxID=2220073 RepID=UPI001159466E|nr:KGG domain-containing protein [Bdellovibrio sp. NC01]QDK38169.1 hypothetical protein DOE51_11540 [Bdellovibrio sp. NC01]
MATRSSSSRRHSSGSSRRGFASMDPEEHRRISAMGGHASHGGKDGQVRRSRDEDYDEDNYKDDEDYRENESRY